MILNNPYVDVRNVRRAYGDDVAVDDVSFQIARGEVFGLLGPNGAGKTTLLRILNTVLPADEGDVTIDGLSVVAILPACGPGSACVHKASLSMKT